MKVLVTGVCGFIGMHVAIRLLEQGHEIVGLDNINDYYDVTLKHDRLARIKPFDKFRFIKLDIADAQQIEALFAKEKFQRVVNLAAQAGVRYSLINPHAYISSNIVGFTNILEGCRHNQVEHLVYASSSSVYGSNSNMPFSVHQNVDHPVSFYAATKKSNELMAHSYSHLYALPTTGLRFFTVYGPWGRPDMAPSLFAGAIQQGRPINVFNKGKMQRDFTYIDDIVEGVVRVLDQVAKPDTLYSNETPDPGRLALLNSVKNGIGSPAQPKQWSNRIHSDDCAGFLVHLVNRYLKGQKLEKLYLGTDCEPAAQHDMRKWLAGKLNVILTEEAKSSRAGTQRYTNKKLLQSGYQLQYPSYREGYVSVIKSLSDDTER